MISKTKMAPLPLLFLYFTYPEVVLSHNICPGTFRKKSFDLAESIDMILVDKDISTIFFIERMILLCRK